MDNYYLVHFHSIQKKTNKSTNMINDLDIKVVKKYRKQILFYINNNCNLNQKIKLKKL